MYHTGDKTTIEANDIAQVLAAPEMIDLADGRQMLLVGLVINPASGKQYAPNEMPEKLHLTDGVSPRLMQFSPLLDVLEPLDIALQAVAEPEMTSGAENAPATAEAAPEAPVALSNAEATSAEPEAAATDNAELPEEPTKEAETETPPEPVEAPEASSEAEAIQA